MPASTAGRRRSRTALTPEERAARLAAARGQLLAGVDKLTTADGWQQLVESRRWLRKYSLANQIMILQQCPEASDVRPLSEWNAAGYRMRKGTHQIKIWAPSFRRFQEQAATTGTGEDTHDTDGQTETVLTRFILVNVVDVSQLDSLPERAAPPVPAELHGDAPAGLWDGVAALIRAEGFVVERGDCGGAYGTTDWASRTVRVRDDVEPAQAAKTLTHEVAHILCGHEHRTDTPRRLREVEAESVACVVTAVCGLDTLPYSVPYVAGWANDRETAHASAERVLAVADRVLAELGAPPPTHTVESAAVPAPATDGVA